MARLPQPGGDDGNWGTLLNDFLSVTHNADGTIRAGLIAESQLDTAVQAKLNGSGVTSVNTRSGAVTLSKSDVNLANVDNTSDANKPISTATQTALDTRPIFVFVSTGSETRPTAAHVVWVGGTSRPANSINGDLWLSETP